MHDQQFLTWPPTPQMALAIFPYVRSVYYNLWRETVLPYEVKLNRQLLGLPPLEENENRANNRNGRGNGQNAPANGEGGLLGMLQGLLDILDPDDEDGEAEGGQAGGEIRVAQLNGGGEGGGLELELVIEEVADDPQQARDNDDEHPAENGPVDHENEPAPPPVVRLEAAEAAPAPADPVVNANDDAGANNAALVDDQHEAPQAPPARQPSLGTILHNIANALAGALVLPVISHLMGEALRVFVLPKSWTRETLTSRPGLFQQQWGRSLVGGSMYVVMKDILRVYTKQRKVAAMGTRKVKNVERSRRQK